MISGKKSSAGTKRRGGDREQEPLYLLALDSPRPPEPHRHRRDRPDGSEADEDAQCAEHRETFHVGHAFDADGIFYPIIHFLSGQGSGEHSEYDRA